MQVPLQNGEVGDDMLTGFKGGGSTIYLASCACSSVGERNARRCFTCNVCINNVSCVKYNRVMSNLSMCKNNHILRCSMFDEQCTSAMIDVHRGPLEPNSTAPIAAAVL